MTDASEPHILARWYAMRQAAWWRGARWTAYAAYLLPLLLSVQAVLFSLYVFYVRGWQSGVVQSSGLVSNVFVVFYRELGAVLIVAAELTIGVALAMAGWQLRGALVPDELAVTQSPRDLEAFRTAYIRRSVWRWVLRICMPHLGVALFGSVLLIVLGRQGRWGGWNFSPADWLMYMAVFGLLAEVAILLARNHATVQSLVVLPLGIYMLWRGAIGAAWSLLNDLEQSDVLTTGQEDLYRLGLSLGVFVACRIAADRLRRPSAAIAAGATMHAPP